MYAAFAEGIGSFGTEVQKRSTLPPKALGKFGHTGNYIFKAIEDANQFKDSHGSYVAVVASDHLRLIIYNLDRQRYLATERGFVEQGNFRVQLNETNFTLGVLFHDRAPTLDELKGRAYVIVLDSNQNVSIVLKRENMFRGKLDRKNRIAWGEIRGIVHCGATARSMSTIVGTANRIFRIRRAMHTFS